jgi:hypothetical protein
MVEKMMGERNSKDKVKREYSQTFQIRLEFWTKKVVTQRNKE